MIRDPRDWGTAVAVTLIVLACIATGGAIGTALALGWITDDPRATARTLICAAAVVGIAGDLLYMAPLARRLVRAYWQDLRRWRDARYCRRHRIPVEGLDVDVQARVAEALHADAARLLNDSPRGAV